MASFMLIPMAVPVESDASEATAATADVDRSPSITPTSANPTFQVVASHYLMVKSKSVVQESSPEPFHLSASQSTERIPMTQGAPNDHQVGESASSLADTHVQDRVACQNATISYENPRDLHDDGQDDSTIATDGSFDSSPPLSYVQVPARAYAGMELSKDCWRSMYFSSQHAKRKLHRIVESVLVENRHLKRQLIQLQKRVNESRRESLLGTTTTQPWSIPNATLTKRRRHSVLEENTPE